MNENSNNGSPIIPDHRWNFVDIELQWHFRNEVTCSRSGLVSHKQSDLQVDRGDLQRNNWNNKILWYSSTVGRPLTYDWSRATNCSYGSWELYLHAMHGYLPLIASAGHYSWLIIRRGEKYLTGLDSVLTIEQPILRFLKPSWDDKG